MGGFFHCGLRAFRKEAIEHLGLRTLGMEFASEMVVKATAFGLRITEIPTTLSPDGRERTPHLRTWRDGWRHLRFLLLYSPRWLFLYPGIALFVLGAVVSALLLPGPRMVGKVGFDIDTLLFGAMAILFFGRTVSKTIRSGWIGRKEACWCLPICGGISISIPATNRRCIWPFVGAA